MKTRLFLVPLALVAAGAIAAACGDDEERLSEEEYFAEVDTLNRDVDASAEEAFSAETADVAIDELLSAVDTFEEGLRDLNPPEDIEDLHDEYVAAVDEFVDFLESASEDVEEGAPIDELQNVFFADGGDPFVDIEAVECELVGIAEEAGIALEFLSCADDEEGGEEGEEGGDPGANPAAVEGTEFEFTFDESAFTTETTGIVFTNTGEQPHDLIVFAVDDATIEEAIEVVGEDGVPPEDAPTVGATGAGPGGDGALAFETPLTPGRYLMLCFVRDEESGELHAELGMAAELTVE